MNEKPTITEILVNNFGRDKSLSELADDYEALELEIDNEMQPIRGTPCLHLMSLASRRW
jgi:hypothetical protein